MIITNLQQQNLGMQTATSAKNHTVNSNKNVNFGNLKVFNVIFENPDLPCAYCGRQMLPKFSYFKHCFNTKRGQDAILWLQSLLPLSDENGKKYIERFCLALKQDEFKFATLEETKYEINERVKKNLLPYVYTQCKVPETPIAKSLLEFVNNILNSDLSARRSLGYIKEGLQECKVCSTEDKTFLEQFIGIINEFDVLRKGVIFNSHLSKRMRTIEYILPYSLGGDGRGSNILFVCHECNMARSNTNFKEFTNLHPEVLPNITRQLKLADSMLSSTSTTKADWKTKKAVEQYLRRICCTLERQLGRPFKPDLPFFNARSGIISN